MLFRQFGLIGGSLRHSFSQRYFTEKFASEGINAAYSLYELSSMEELQGLLARMPALVGLNVTIPYKEAIIPYLTRLDKTAQAVGAVNTVHFTDKGLIGYNTDVTGLEVALHSLLAGAPAIKQAIILGTGGAAKAAYYVLTQRLGIAKVRFVSRNPTDEMLSYHDLGAVLSEVSPTLIINATPVGTFPHVDKSPDIPFSLLTTNMYVLDMVYNPAETRFMQLAAQQGAHVQNGLQMLYAQAEKAWEIWSS